MGEGLEVKDEAPEETDIWKLCEGGGNGGVAVNKNKLLLMLL